MAGGYGFTSSCSKNVCKNVALKFETPIAFTFPLLTYGWRALYVATVSSIVWQAQCTNIKSTYSNPNISKSCSTLAVTFHLSGFWRHHEVNVSLCTIGQHGTLVATKISFLGMPRDMPHRTAAPTSLCVASLYIKAVSMPRPPSSSHSVWFEEKVPGVTARNRRTQQSSEERQHETQTHDRQQHQFGCKHVGMPTAPTPYLAKRDGGEGIYICGCVCVKHVLHCAAAH